ncbi:MAG: hypothetical protein P8179_06570 [Candidatus Thiodiazotropha sp.]
MILKRSVGQRESKLFFQNQKLAIRMERSTDFFRMIGLVTNLVWCFIQIDDYSVTLSS